MSVTDPIIVLLFPCCNCPLFPTDFDYSDYETTDTPTTSFDFSDWLFDYLDISKSILFAHWGPARPSPWMHFIPLSAPDVCSPNPCLNGASCITTSPSEFRCACVEPYTGKRCQKGTRCPAGSDEKAFSLQILFAILFQCKVFWKCFLYFLAFQQKISAWTPIAAMATASST